LSSYLVVLSFRMFSFIIFHGHNDVAFLNIFIREIMNSTLKSLTIVSLLAASSFASAEGWSFSGGYANYMEDDAGVDISLGAIYASAGYTYNSGKMSFMPELRLGFGVSDDSIQGIDIEIDTLLIASIRGQYNVTENFGVFLQPSYGRLEATASSNGFSVTEDEWEFGFGGGASFQISESSSIEAVYEAFDEADVLSVGFRTTF
jgi:opacity protein-like surface antigen